MEIGLVQLSQSVKTTHVTHTDRHTDRQTDRQTKLNNGTLYAPRYEEAFWPKGKKRTRSLRCLGLAPLKTKKNDKKSAQPKTHHEIHSRPATTTNSRRRAKKHVPRVSPYSHASSMDPGFVEISLACIHAYPHCCCCAGCGIRFGL